MKLKFDAEGLKRSQPDPFIFEDGGSFYLYVTAYNGVEAYTSDSPFGEWKFKGVVCAVEGCVNYWAPCVIKLGGVIYMYFSCTNGNAFEYLHVASSENPLGPFCGAKRLFDRFSIDAHAVETSAGLFLWYAEDNTDTDRIGTRVYVDKMLDPYTPAREPVEAIVPTFDEEIFMRNRFGDRRDWHTIEGAFWFSEGEWQYVMYSGGCYENDSYHIGYCAAKTNEPELTRVRYIKHTDGGRFDPVMIKNGLEEGVGHHSVIKYNGDYYAVYHGRDLKAESDESYVERRTARICRLNVENGVITAER